MPCHMCYTDMASLLCGVAHGTDNDPSCEMTWGSIHIYTASPLPAKQVKSNQLVTTKVSR